MGASTFPQINSRLEESAVRQILCWARNSLYIIYTLFSHVDDWCYLNWYYPFIQDLYAITIKYYTTAYMRIRYSEIRETQFQISHCAIVKWVNSTLTRNHVYVFISLRVSRECPRVYTTSITTFASLLRYVKMPARILTLAILERETKKYIFRCT